jgi:hypothetical protein
VGAFVKIKELFNAQRDRENTGIVNQFRGILGTLSLPVIFSRAMRASLPAIGFAAGEFLKALHPESPGGIGLTRAEGRSVIRGAAERLERGLAEEFLDDLRPDAGRVVEDEEPEEPKAKRGRKAKEPESEPKTPVTTEPTEPKAE